MNNKLNWSTKQNTIEEKKTTINKEEITVRTEHLMNLMENFLLQADIQENSKKTYFKGLKKFINWNIEQKKENIILSKESLINYKNELTKSNITPHTQAIYLVSLKQFFVWTEANLIFPNIAKNIKNIKKITKQHHKDPLKKEDIVKLLTINNKENIIELRNFTILHLLIFTGLRIGEATSILISDIELINEKKSILWIKGKGRSGKDNFVILLDESTKSIKEYINLRRLEGENITESSFLFIAHGSNSKENQKLNTDSISRIINKKMKSIQIKTKRISAHSLRHSFGVHAIESGVSLHDLQIAMRHSTPNTTQVYLGDIEKMKRKEGKTEEQVFNFIKNIQKKE
jgi:site-specific recombinase XerD